MCRVRSIGSEKCFSLVVEIHLLRFSILKHANGTRHHIKHCKQTRKKKKLKTNKTLAEWIAAFHFMQKVPRFPVSGCFTVCVCARERISLAFDEHTGKKAIAGFMDRNLSLGRYSAVCVCEAHISSECKMTWRNNLHLIDWYHREYWTWHVNVIAIEIASVICSCSCCCSSTLVFSSTKKKKKQNK